MKDKKFKSLIGNECATWNCDGLLIEDGKLSFKCSECGRTYWKDELFNATSIDKEKKQKAENEQEVRSTRSPERNSVKREDLI